MNTHKSTTGIDPKVKLSLLWIFVLLNMAYADILSLMDPACLIRGKMAGFAWKWTNYEASSE